MEHLRVPPRQPWTDTRPEARRGVAPLPLRRIARSAMSSRRLPLARRRAPSSSSSSSSPRLRVPLRQTPRTGSGRRARWSGPPPAARRCRAAASRRGAARRATRGRSIGSSTPSSVPGVPTCARLLRRRRSAAAAGGRRARPSSARAAVAAARTVTRQTRAQARLPAAGGAAPGAASRACPSAAGRLIAAARSVWRASAVTPAARAPLPQTSPITSSQRPSPWSSTS